MSNKQQEELIQFLKKYRIAYIDQQTSIITEINSQHTLLNDGTESSEQFFRNFKWYQHNMSVSRKKYGNIQQMRKKEEVRVNAGMPKVFLVKDLILDDLGQNQSILKTALQTLSLHQQLNNKYLLTLLHHQIFTKQTSSMSFQKEVQTDTNRQFNNQQHIIKLKQKGQKIKDKGKEHRTQIQQSDEEDSMNSKSQNKESRFTNKFNNTNIQNQNLNQSEANYTMQTQIMNCSNHLVYKTAVRAIYEYGSLTLQEQIFNRIASSTKFQEEELWAILATIVQALSYLQSEGIIYGVLGTDKIFINNSLVKVLDPSATGTDPLLISQGRLYSPQILNDQQNIDMFKSDIYVTGLIMIQCGLLVDLSKQVEPNLQQYLQNFKKLYSKQLYEIIEMCLSIRAQDRPSFEQLKYHLAQQLDMNDFESAYDAKGLKLLKPLFNDQEDNPSLAVNQIQIELEEDNYDILYESIGEQDLNSKKKIMTDYQRAQLRYLGFNYTKRSSRLLEQQRMNKKHQHKYASSTSPIITRRNSKNRLNAKQNDRVQNSNTNNKYPNLKMGMCESIYPDQYTPTTEPVEKTNRKSHNFQQKYQNRTSNRDKKQNMVPPMAISKKSIPNIPNNEKIKKTKLIKQKLVKNQEQNQHTFGSIKSKKSSYPINANIHNSIGQFANTKKNEPLQSLRESKHYQKQQLAYGKCNGISITEQIDEESQNSHLYYNQNGSSRASKYQQSSSRNSRVQNNNLRTSKGSHNSQNHRYNNFQSEKMPQLSAHQNQILNTGLNRNKQFQNDQIFTDPNLMRTIKDDLARISSTKNMQLVNSRQRWFK